MKIVYLCNSLYNGGGTERIVTTKANYLSKNYNYSVYIILTNNKNKDSYFKLEKNVKVIDLGVNYNSLKGILKYLYKLSSKLKQINPDVVFATCGQEAIPYSLIDKKRFKVRELHFSKKGRSIQNEKSKLIRKVLIKIYNKLEEKSVQKYSKLIVLTNEDKKYWEHKNIDVIYNPKTIETKKVAKLKNKKAIAVGRLDYQKGFDRLIRAWALSPKEWILEIYGDGPLKNELQKLIIDLNQEKNIFLMGATKNIENHLLNSSLYVLSSRHEGLPLVLLEAMECGLPIVSFDCPCGPKDVIIDNFNGFLVKNNDIKDLNRKIEILISDEKLRENIGKNSKLESEKYSLDLIMKKWKFLIENTIYQKLRSIK